MKEGEEVSKMEKREIEKLSWKQFGEILLRLANEIQLTFDLDVIIGVGKSGIIPASILAKRMNVDEFYSIIVQLYNEEKPPRKLYQRPHIIFSSISSLDGKKVLIVDDFVNTGATLKMVLQKATDAGAKEVRTAVVGLRFDAIYKPDYSGMSFKGCLWFPWDVPLQNFQSN
jgi:xanthine phosphoribosyltransferase